MKSRFRRSHRSLLDFPDEDPLSTMANLFDTGMVFAVALMVALVSLYGVRVDGGRVEPTRSEPSALEKLEREGVIVERYRESESVLGGEGERLGMAYRLSTGEIVYVPEDSGAEQDGSGR